MIVVQHKSNLLFVDAHPKRIRRHHDLNLTLHEQLLCVVARRCGKPGVVGLSRYVAASQQARKPLRLFSGRYVYYARSAVFGVAHDLLNETHSKLVALSRCAWPEDSKNEVLAPE